MWKRVHVCLSSEFCWRDARAPGKVTDGLRLLGTARFTTVERSQSSDEDTARCPREHDEWVSPETACGPADIPAVLPANVRFDISSSGSGYRHLPT